MRYTPLLAVKHRVAVGQPLPFNVFNRDHTLLLAKSQVIDSAEQLQALFDRGMLVDLAELYRDAGAIAQAPRELLPALWADNLAQISQALRRADSPTFREAIDETSAPVQALIARDPDLAIFQVMRHEASAHVQYGLDHSLHAAIVCRLVAQRLAWSPDEATRAFKAALTMNISMLELQGQLASQVSPPTERQRREIRSHPIRSRDMLIAAGITDVDWLRAVEQHHEKPDASGYPLGLPLQDELATLLQRADIYTAKLSPRLGREAVAADRAGREIFMSDPSSPINAALVKEFGVYPPGSFVRLHCGETGIVVQRGPTVMAPVVAALTNPQGLPHERPVRRDTTERAYAVVGIVPAKAVSTRMKPEQLAELVTR